VGPGDFLLQALAPSKKARTEPPQPTRRPRRTNPKTRRKTWSSSPGSATTSKPCRPRSKPWAGRGGHAGRAGRGIL